jgi:release factor glutamine methyltransferase
MNENYQPKTPAINDWVEEATKKLQSAGIKSARLDAELILAHTIRKPRTYIHAHGKELIDGSRLEIANARIELRLDMVPVAYIIGHKEFYGRKFNVTAATLVPRPESETLIEMLSDLVSKNQQLIENTLHLVDVGTGSGCLGITAKLEHPELTVTLLDISRHALNVAEKNAAELNADVSIIKSDLLEQYPYKANFIIANLPYVNPEWEVSPETAHEPEQALFAKDNGKALINQLIEQAPLYVAPEGVLLIEADPRQHKDLIAYAHKFGFNLLKTEGFCLAMQYRPKAT